MQVELRMIPSVDWTINMIILVSGVGQLLECASKVSWIRLRTFSQFCRYDQYYEIFR